MNCYQCTFSEAIEKLEQKEISYLHIVYGAFACKDKALVEQAGRAIIGLLESYTMEQMIRLSEKFRQYTSMEWQTDWGEISLHSLRENFSSSQDYVYALILGSFHPNGYFRESCIRELAEYPDTLPYLVLRMNDWVKPVRESAFYFTMIKMKDCSLHEILQSAPAIEKLHRSQRCSRDYIRTAQERMMERIRSECNTVLLDQISGCEFAVRKNIYRLLFTDSILDLAKADELLKSEKHSFCQSLIITGILRFYPCTEERIQTYLHHKSSCVRRKALEYQYQITGGIWPGLESMLLDSNMGIRELAAYYLRRHSELDIAGYYLTHLSDEKPETAILGLGETGGKETASFLMPFLNHSLPKVVQSTLLSLGRLLGEEGSQIFRKYLLDDRPSVKKAAYRVICANHIQYGAEWIYETYLAAEDMLLRRYLLKLLFREPSWKRLPYLLLLSGTVEDEHLEACILGRMRMRSLYVKLSRAEEQRILAILSEKEKQLPERLAADIRFDLKFIVK